MIACLDFWIKCLVRVTNDVKWNSGSGVLHLHPVSTDKIKIFVSVSGQMRTPSQFLG